MTLHFGDLCDAALLRHRNRAEITVLMCEQKLHPYDFIPGILWCEHSRVNSIKAMYERPRGNVKVERGSTFTFTRVFPCIRSILFTCVRT